MENNQNNLENQNIQPESDASPELNTTSAEPAATPSTESTPETAPSKKKVKTHLICIIAALIILLGGGGAFATFVLIKTSPNNAAIDAFSNLVNAKQVAIDGHVSFKTGFLIGNSTVDLNFNTKVASSGHSTDISIKLTFTDGSTIEVANFGEVMLNNGILYLKVGKINEFYQTYLRETISPYLTSLASWQIHNQMTSDCYSAGGNYSTCHSSDYYSSPESQQLIEERTTSILDDIDHIVASIDGNWFEFSIDEILNSDFVVNKLSVPAIARQGISSAYNCIVNNANNFPSYATDLSSYYGKYPFINLTPTSDNYYALSANPAIFADFINNAEDNVSIYLDAKACVNTSFSGLNYSYKMTAEDAKRIIENSPEVAIRYEGFLSHHLTDIRIKNNDTYYPMTAQINFSYPDNLQISAPSEHRPIIDLVEEIYKIITTKIFPSY